MWGKNCLLLERIIDKPTITIGDFNNLLSIIGRMSKQKIMKELEDLNNTIIELPLSTLYPTIEKYALF